MAITAPPAPGEVTSGDGKVFQLLYDTADVVAQGPNVAAPEIRTLASGVLSLENSRNVWVDTEGGVALGVLTSIDLDTLPENLDVRIRQANVAHVVDIIHLVNAGVGGGEFWLNAVEEAGGTIRLDSLEKSITVERRGSTIYELRRDGFGGTGGGIDGALTEPLDGGDQTVSRLLWTMEDAPLVSGEYVAAITDSGKWKNVRTDGRIKLPDPNATGSGWRMGHVMTWQQWGSLLNVITHVGTTPNNPLNHDRGSGIRAVLQTIVCQENNGTLSWLLSGMTAGVAPGGGGTISRSYFNTDVLATVDLPVGSTAFVNCGSITFTPTATSDYLLFTDATFSADAISGTNNSTMRLVNTAAPTTALCEVGRPRQASQEQRCVFKLGVTFGASPSAQTYRLDAANGSATTFSTRVEGQQFLALKLATDEGYANQSGVVSDINQTYDVVATKTMTLPAGTYVFFAQFSVGVVTDARWSGKLTVAGVDYNETPSINATTNLGLYDTIRVLTVTAGSVTFSTSIKSGGAGGTATATHGIVGVLAAARFQVFDYGESIAETTPTVSATLTPKISKTTTLQSAWRSLVLCSMQAHCAADVSNGGISIELHRNGTRVGPDAEHGVREQSGATTAYSNVSWGGMGLMAPQLTNDSFTLNYASNDGTTAVKVASASIAIMALAPL